MFEQRNYGYVIFQRAPGLPLYVYEELHIHIGNAIHGHNLVNELREMSLRDELTGLYNRRGFTYLGNHLISQARRSGTSVCIMYGDINKLKPINDNYGHAEGDFAISKTAELLHRVIREQDIIARIGGDEFTVIAIDLEENECQDILDRIQTTFKIFNSQKLRPYSSHMHTGMGAQDVAEESGVSISLLRRLFQKYKESSPREVFNELRMKRALELMHSTAYSFWEIANECGFTSQSAFNKAFIRYWKKTPSKAQLLPFQAFSIDIAKASL